MARLNGWRRLWVVWAALCLPVSVVLAEKTTSGSSEWERVFEEKHAALRVTYEAADRRIRPPLTGNAETDAAASSRVIAQLINGGDDQMRSEVAAIEKEYEPRLERAYQLKRQVFWMMTGGLWVFFTGFVYLLGALAAWVRRGFSVDPDSQPKQS